MAFISSLVIEGLRCDTDRASFLSIIGVFEPLSLNDTFSNEPVF